MEKRLNKKNEPKPSPFPGRIRYLSHEEMDNLLKGCAISSLKDTPHNKGRTFSKMITAYLKPIVQIAIHSVMRRGGK